MSRGAPCREAPLLMLQCPAPSCCFPPWGIGNNMLHYYSLSSRAPQEFLFPVTCFLNAYFGSWTTLPSGQKELWSASSSIRSKLPPWHRPTINEVFSWLICSLLAMRLNSFFLHSLYVWHMFCMYDMWTVLDDTHWIWMSDHLKPCQVQTSKSVPTWSLYACLCSSHWLIDLSLWKHCWWVRALYFKGQ